MLTPLKGQLASSCVPSSQIKVLHCSAAMNTAAPQSSGRAPLAEQHHDSRKCLFRTKSKCQKSGDCYSKLKGSFSASTPEVRLKAPRGSARQPETLRGNSFSCIQSTIARTKRDHAIRGSMRHVERDRKQTSQQLRLLLFA